MCARELPPASQAAEGEGGGARSPLKVAQLESLWDAFRQVPDPRAATSRRQPLPALLGLIALGLLLGARDVLGALAPASTKMRSTRMRACNCRR